MYEIPRQTGPYGVTKELLPSNMKDSTLSSSRKRILLLSWCLPGMSTGSAVVVEELARQFQRGEMVVAGENAGFALPEDWSDSLPGILPLTHGGSGGLPGGGFDPQNARNAPVRLASVAGCGS